jgi:predicted butyrate kinase (DUF1464 family)
LVKAIAGLRAVTKLEEVVLSGSLLKREPELVGQVARDLSLLVRVLTLPSLPGAWVKHAAQGAALLADGLAGGCYAPLVKQIELKSASGSVLDWLYLPRRVTI